MASYCLTADMKTFGHLVLMVAVAGLLLAGCNKKETPLVSTEGTKTGTTGETAPSTTGTSGEPSTTGTSAATSTGTTGSATSTPGQLKTENPAIDESGQMIKKEEGRPAPAGRVWCENCLGHLPKEDAVTKNDKTYCPACAAELKL